MILIIGVRFRKSGKIYYFDPIGLPIEKGNHVIVETARGVEYGTVVLGPKQVTDDKIVSPLKPVMRIATEKDDAINEENEAKEKDAFKKGIIYLEKLGSASEVEFVDSKDDAPENSVTAVTSGAELYMPLLDLIDLEKELERLNKEKDKLQSEIDRVEKKLSNERFVSKAPEAVVAEEKAKGEKYKEMYKAVVERLETLQK